MTRRKFMQRLAAACGAVVVGAGWLAKKAGPRRFVRAIRTKFYPGSLRPMGDISKPGKWSG